MTVRGQKPAVFTHTMYEGYRVGSQRARTAPYDVGKQNTRIILVIIAPDGLITLDNSILRNIAACLPTF